MPITSDRRQCGRIEVKWPVTALMERTEIRAEMGNLSPSGVLIYSKEAVASRNQLRLFIEAPDNHTLRAEGIVAWSSAADTREHDLPQKAGIKFISISEDDRNYLGRFITGISEHSRWQQLRRIQVSHLLSVIALAIVLAVVYYTLNSKIEAVSKNILSGLDTAVQKVEEKVTTFAAMQEDVKKIPNIQKETGDAVRRVSMITEKINYVLLPEIEGLRRNVYGQSAPLERIALSLISSPDKRDGTGESGAEPPSTGNVLPLLSEPQASSSEPRLEESVAIVRTAPTETTLEPYRRLKLGSDLYAVAEVTALDSAALTPREAEQSARANAKTKLLMLIEARVRGILKEFATSTGKEPGGIVEAWPRQFPERIGRKVIPVVTLSQVSHKEGKEEIQVLLSVKKGDVLGVLEDEIEKEIIESNSFSPEERREAQARFKSILEAETRKSTDVFWKIL